MAESELAYYVVFEAIVCINLQLVRANSMLIKRDHKAMGPKLLNIVRTSNAVVLNMQEESGIKGHLGPRLGQRDMTYVHY